MSGTDDKEQGFPEGFEHVEERLTETTNRLKQLDDQLKNTPKERGPKPEYRPPYYVGGIVPGSRDRTRISLQEKQHEIRMDTLSKAEEDTRDAKSPVGRVVRDQVRETLFPNPYRQVSRDDRLDDQKIVKDIEQSQDYMDAELVARAAERDAVPQPEKQVTSPDKEDKASLSMSARFSMSLGYTKAREKADRSPEFTRSRDQGKDRE